MISVTLCIAWLALHVRGKNTKKLVWYMSLVPSTLVAAFRYNNGADYLMYMRMMEHYSLKGTWVDTYTIVKDIEIGFVLLLKFFCGITNQWWFVFGVIAFIIGFFFFKGIWENSDNLLLSVLLFFVTGVYFDSFNGLRQFIATAIIFYAFKHIIKGEFKKYLCWCLIASAFHYSAVIMIPVYFIRKLDIGLKKSLTVVAITVFGSKVIYDVISNFLQYTRYGFFLQSTEFEVIPTAGAILFTSVVSLLAYIYRALRPADFNTEKIRIMYAYQLLVWLSALLSLAIPLALRLQGYFLCYEILFIPMFLSNVKNKKIRICYVVLFLGMYTVATVWGMLNNGWYTSVPYNFYFNYR